MKTTLFSLMILFSVVINAQTFDYDNSWTEIQNAANQGEVKSLLPKINEILTQAKRDGNSVELINSLIFRAQIVAQTQEDGEGDLYKSAILDFEREIPQFDGVAKSVLQSLLANIYLQYEQNTGWKRRNITELDLLPEDIAEWSSKQLLKKSLDLYAQSVETHYIAYLQQEKTENWKKFLTSTEDIDLFPTLYDVLGYRYYLALKNYQFSSIINQENKKNDISEADILLNKLIKFHENDENKSAFLCYKLNSFVNLDIDWKDRAEMILKLAEKYRAEPFSAYLFYRAAQMYQSDGNKKLAYEICKKVEYDPNNKWTENTKSLIAEIEMQQLWMTMDEVSLPNEPIAVTISATNIDKVYYRIYNATQTVGQYNIENERGNLLKSGSWDLQHFDDFSEHTTIIALDRLTEGNYCIEIANNPDFSKEKTDEDTDDLTNEMYFSVHNLSAVSFGDNSFQILDRKKGLPIANKDFVITEVIIYNNIRDEISVKTDEKGFFKLDIDEKKYYGQRFIYNSVSKTYIFINDVNYINNIIEEKEQLKLNFFTDRAIYRPGQIVYFKAILYSKNKNEAEIVKNRKVKIELKNVNHETISELELISNDYGSVFGEFVLPQNGLTGNYFLQTSTGYGYKSFRMEEYKRPKFEVVMDSLKGEFVLEQEVKTAGKAESFAGAAISEAKVVYRVERLEIFPYPVFRMIFPPRYSSPETITQGETITDSEGKFTISFIAKPKNEKKKGEYRTYTYSIFADVTDINGETHSIIQHLTIGDLPKILTLNLPQKSLQKDFTKIGIKSTNLNGVEEHSQGQIIITQLISPDRIILPDKTDNTLFSWQYRHNSQKTPDYQLYTKKEFIKLFPHLPYSEDETKPEKWQKGKILTYNFNTQTSGNVDIKRLEKGFYIIEAFTMFGKDSIKISQVVEIQDDKTLKSTDNTFFEIYTDKSSYKVGDKINISLISDFKNVTVFLNIESGGKWVEKKIIPITKGIVNYSIIANENHIKDGLFVSAYLLKENGFKQHNLQIQIKDKPYDLKISTKTFRNKIYPGQPETWELTISGTDKEKITAEVLATMYDASLDVFVANSFKFNPLAHTPYGRLYQNVIIQSYNSKNLNIYLSPYPIRLNYITPFFSDLENYSPYGIRAIVGNGIVGDRVVPVTFDSAPSLSGVEVRSSVQFAAQKLAIASNNNTTNNNQNNIPQPRRNLQETAFFYPNLYTDQNGDVKLSFTSPEALTRWKLLILAHTQDLYSGTAEFYTQTQKELMVVPNLPRFLREGDEMVISAKINNLSNRELGLSGNVKLILTDALNNTNIEIQNQEQKFIAEKGKNAEVRWRFRVPKILNFLEYTIIATTENGEFSDGEQGILPVLPNRMLVTETMPIYAKEGQTKTFTFERLKNLVGAGLQPVPENAAITTGRDAINRVSTMENFNLTLELTTNPLWLAVMSLPYLREYPYECSEQIFSRLYGNLLSTHILNSNPKIKRVFDNWTTLTGLKTLLELNEELKNILLEETPWVRQAQSETEQRKRLALLFDLNKMSQEFDAAQQKLIQCQNADGGFAWFKGGRSNVYITEHIVMGFGQLQKMLGKNNNTLTGFKTLLELAIKYIDNEHVKTIKRREEDIKKYGGKIDGKDFIHYYYVRSFWKNEYPLPAEAKKYLDDINQNISEYFKTYDLQRKAMIATTLQRYGYENSAKIIIKNLKETSVETDEMGMYWKENRAGWLWYQSPVEAQTKAIEAFAEIGSLPTPAGAGLQPVPENAAITNRREPETIAVEKYIEEMKIWLLKNRQTNAWNNTKATTNAVYALMNFGKDWTNAEEGVNVQVGNTLIAGADLQSVPETAPITNRRERVGEGLETAAGYIKTSWKGAEITPDKGTVKVTKTSPGTMWGGMYWQYFEDLDKITQANTNLKMEKSLFLKKNTDGGQKLIPIAATVSNDIAGAGLQPVPENNVIKIGDLVSVRLVIHIDRDMEYIHIKDMRASGFEPVNVLSNYKFQNGCAYYESTRDAATNFFFERMTKGTYVFEYDVRANDAGTFSNGITTLQNMYAPEMTCHSAGLKVEIRER